MLRSLPTAAQSLLIAVDRRSSNGGARFIRTRGSVQLPTDPASPSRDLLPAAGRSTRDEGGGAADAIVPAGSEHRRRHGVQRHAAGGDAGTCTSGREAPADRAISRPQRDRREGGVRVGVWDAWIRRAASRARAERRRRRRRYARTASFSRPVGRYLRGRGGRLSQAPIRDAEPRSRRWTALTGFRDSVGCWRAHGASVSWVGGWWVGRFGGSIDNGRSV
jgi:hypothetical protein